MTWHQRNSTWGTLEQMEFLKPRVDGLVVFFDYPTLGFVSGGHFP
jgi:hypothetical protein